jgi:hypothetical protein
LYAIEKEIRGSTAEVRREVRQTRAAPLLANMHVWLDTTLAKRALRVVALGRKNFLFASSDQGGQRAATMYSLLGSAKAKQQRSLRGM